MAALREASAAHTHTLHACQQKFSRMRARIEEEQHAAGSSNSTRPSTYRSRSSIDDTLAQWHNASGDTAGDVVPSQGDAWVKRQRTSAAAAEETVPVSQYQEASTGDTQTQRQNDPSVVAVLEPATTRQDQVTAAEASMIARWRPLSGFEAAAVVQETQEVHGSGDTGIEVEEAMERPSIGDAGSTDSVDAHSATDTVESHSERYTLDYSV